MALLSGLLVTVLPRVVGANFLYESSHVCDSSLASQPCLANGTYHTYAMDVGGNFASAVNGTLYDSYDTTDLYIAPAQYDHSSDTDVYYYYDNALPATVLGRTSCLMEGTHAAKCDHFHVRFNQQLAIDLGWGDGTAADQSRLQAIACHETGHTVGLTHVEGNESLYQCMSTPIDADTPHTMGTHNVGHVNGYY